MVARAVTGHGSEWRPRTGLLAALALSAITAGVFWPVAGYEFIAFDDNVYVYENAIVAQGLSLEGIRSAFTTPVSAHWHPLTMISLMMDASLYGMNAGGFHVTNLLLHLVNVALLFGVLHAMTGTLSPSELWPSAIVAAIFAIHPLHVEPVAWISSRKDVLSALFWLLAMGAYVRYSRSPNVAQFAIVAVCMTLGLLAKSIVAVLPIVLLALDYWPLQRFSLDDWRNREKRGALIRAVAEKAALLPLGLVVLFINARAQDAAGQVAPAAQMNVWDRVANAAVTYATYLEQAIVPRGLTLYYPLPADGYAASAIALSAIVVAGLCAVAVVCARRAPAVAMGIAWFFVVLAPVAGFVQLGAQAHADRYMYLPLIGLAIAVVWPAWRWAQTLPRPLPVTAAAAALIVTLASVSSVTLTHWRDSASAFERALALTDANYLIHYNYGVALESQGDLDGALAQYGRAIAAHGGHAASHVNAGALLAARGDYEAAIEHFHLALDSEPGNVVALCNLAVALADAGKPGEALAPLGRAVAAAPDSERTAAAARWVLAAQRAQAAE